MITIRFPLTAFADWIMPVFLILIGLFNIIVGGFLPMVIAGIILLGGGILWALTNLKIVRWNLD